MKASSDLSLAILSLYSFHATTRTMLVVASLHFGDLSSTVVAQLEMLKPVAAHGDLQRSFTRSSIEISNVWIHEA